MEACDPSLSWRRLVVWLLPAVLLPVYYDWSAWRMAGVLGFPLDDAWIHAQFARNLATGHGFTYTGTRWVAGSTSPAWTLTLALGYFVARSSLISAKVIGIALQLGCGLLAARLVFILSGVNALAIAGGLLVAVMPVSVWGAVSGMEVGLASALVLAAFCLYLPAGRRRRKVAAIFLLSLGCLARPETLIVLAIVGGHFLAATSGVRARLSAALWIGLAVLVVLGPFVLFDIATTGRPLPTTFYAKSGRGLVAALTAGDGAQVQRLFLTHGPMAVRKFVETLFDQFGVVAAIVCLGFVASVARPLRRNGAWLVAACVLAAAFAFGLIAPQRLKPENFRYVAPLLSLAAVLGVAGVAMAWAYAPRMLAGMLVLLVGLGGFQSFRAAGVYAVSVKNIQELQVTLAQWMRTHVPPGLLIAANDVGAAGYFSGHEIVDLEGLVSPEALRYSRIDRGIRVAEATRPDYIAIFPAWYPDLSANTQMFHEVYRVEIPDNVVSAGDVLVVYRTPWTRLPVSLKPVPEPKRRRWPA